MKGTVGNIDGHHGWAWIHYSVTASWRNKSKTASAVPLLVSPCQAKPNCQSRIAQIRLKWHYARPAALVIWDRQTNLSSPCICSAQPVTFGPPGCQSNNLWLGASGWFYLCIYSLVLKLCCTQIVLYVMFITIIYCYRSENEEGVCVCLSARVAGMLISLQWWA